MAATMETISSARSRSRGLRREARFSRRDVRRRASLSRDGVGGPSGLGTGVTHVESSKGKKRPIAQWTKFSSGAQPLGRCCLRPGPAAASLRRVESEPQATARSPRSP